MHSNNSRRRIIKVHTLSKQGYCCCGTRNRDLKIRKAQKKTVKSLKKGFGRKSDGVSSEIYVTMVVTLLLSQVSTCILKQTLHSQKHLNTPDEGPKHTCNARYTIRTKKNKGKKTLHKTIYKKQEQSILDSRGDSASSNPRVENANLVLPHPLCLLAIRHTLRQAKKFPPTYKTVIRSGKPRTAPKNSQKQQTHSLAFRRDET